MNKKISELRRNYIKGGLKEEELPQNPVILFRQWFTEALETEVTEPNAMALATVTSAGRPAVRTVLLKGIEDNGIQFFSNYNSDKADDLENLPYAACCFWWAELERQVRISGPVEKLSERVNTEYFETRPRESQIGAWASDQSSVISGRDELIRTFEEFEKKFAGKQIPKPDHWGGYEIGFEMIEFWQGRPGRLHDRILYTTQDGKKWHLKRLAP
ncbi:MAG: pyridoxamine 5'-phosphate oxidase [Balneolaceae bacterium]